MKILPRLSPGGKANANSRALLSAPAFTALARRFLEEERAVADRSSSARGSRRVESSRLEAAGGGVRVGSPARGVRGSGGAGGVFRIVSCDRRQPRTRRRGEDGRRDARVRERAGRARGVRRVR